MGIIVVYKSISGFTEKYAKWLSQELKCECFELSQISQLSLPKESIIVFGGSLHAVGINGLKKLRKVLEDKEYRELIVFAVGASPPKKGIEEEIRKSNFSDEEMNIKLFYLRGGFDYSKLDFKNKVLMTLLKIKIKLKKSRNADEKGMLAAYKEPLDVAKKENLKQIIDYLDYTLRRE